MITTACSFIIIIPSLLSVTEFAKKTGDYRSLSVVDIKVLALTYQLEKENVGTDHIKITPDRKVYTCFTAVIGR